MKSFSKEVSFDTTGRVEFIDITGRVRALCAESGIREGLAAIFTRHTTAAVKINENCPRLVDDMISFLCRAVPESRYRHDEDTVDCRANARGHIQSLFLNTSEIVPVSNGTLALGAWQSVFFVELDGPRSQRAVIVKIIGA